MASSSSSFSNSSSETINFAALIPPHRLDVMVRSWLHNDLPSFDVGGLVVGTVPRTAILWMKSPGVLAGQPFVNAVFHNLDCQIDWHVPEGFQLSDGNTKTHVATVTGPVHRLLQGERTALNIISRCSGVATAANHAVNVAHSILSSWKGHIAGTRKTTPGSFGLVEKYGLLVGGAAMHRMDLSQMCMLKDNHIWSCNGSISGAVSAAKRATGFSQKIEVECQSVHEAREAAQAGADIVMLDNFEPAQLKEDAATLKQEFPHVLIEASGGITTDTIKDYLCEHVDIISQGKLTQGYACIDFSLKIQMED
ncbi:hypothetical protein MPSEU_000917800 [Mayamaea pseudoterrestris]|nr:hypothetical protein MPSEU_000917800 [Mayamaea pseudoterrestris]